MGLELYINDNYIELSKKIKLGLTFQVNNLGDLSTRQSNFSNPFNAPKTKLNRKNLEVIENINSNTNIPYQKNIAKVVSKDGLEIVPSGIAIVGSVSENYNIVVYSGSIDLFEALGDSLITDLDFSDIDHDWTGANVYASRVNTEGYIYPYIDWGKNFVAIGLTNKVFKNLLYPCVFTKTIFDKIIGSKGYTYDGTFIDSDPFPRLIVTPNNFERSEDWIKLRRRSVKLNFEYALDTSDAPLDGTPKTTVFNFDNMSTDGAEMNTGVAFYTSTEYIYGSYNLSGSFTRHNASPAPTSFIVEIINVSGGGFIVATTGDIYADVTYPDEYFFSIDTGNLYIFPTQQFQARITVRYNRISPGITPDIRVNLPTQFTFTPYKRIAEDSFLEFSELLSGDTQTEFIKSVCNMYSVVFSTNGFTKNIEFNFLDDILSNIYKAKDWSSKIDDSDSNILEFKIGNYAQENDFLYEDDETVTKGFGNGSITINDENLPVQKTSVKLIFAATESELKLSSVETPKIKIRLSNGDPEKIISRILLLDRKVSPGNSIKYFNQTSSTSPYATASDVLPYCYFKKTSQDDNLAFDDSLIEKNYKAVSQMLSHTKKITALFKLEAIDIANLNFLIPIYLDVHTAKIQVNGHFYLNKVENYTGEGLTKCELIRL